MSFLRLEVTPAKPCSTRKAATSSRRSRTCWAWNLTAVAWLRREAWRSMRAWSLSCSAQRSRSTSSFSLLSRSITSARRCSSRSRSSCARQRISMADSFCGLSSCEREPVPASAAGCNLGAVPAAGSCCGSGSVCSGSCGRGSRAVPEAREGRAGSQGSGGRTGSGSAGASSPSSKRPASVSFRRSSSRAAEWRPATQRRGFADAMAAYGLHGPSSCG
mmetsp:Transcript_106036/g.330729  ORF Transcript_106036/g.330729 Transcript_106036/m.330729 type:complete len:218 (+) Transcript_106036:44-697(+)